MLWYSVLEALENATIETDVKGTGHNLAMSMFFACRLNNISRKLT
jgi:hypothetical protein